MRQIPSLGAIQPEIKKVLEPIKENIEELRATRGNSVKIEKLPETASNLDIINKINEILTLIQG